jgi:hypothetical protein
MKSTLDLELLEKQLDEALSRETPETLSTWLRERRHKNLMSTLLNSADFANFLACDVESITLKNLKAVSPITRDKDINCPNVDYSFAA